MDYGQPVKTGNDPEFSASGAGTNAEKDNLAKLENEIKSLEEYINSFNGKD